jgi:uncharacterized RDD family membrane protein YckC
MSVSVPGVSLGSGVIYAWPGHEEAGTEVAEVVTGEAVVLEVPCARFPSRLLALALDLLIQFVLMFILLLIVELTANANRLSTASVGALSVTALILVVVGYPVIWETLTRGGTPGKFALGLRVVSDDGGPERFRQALVRGLSAVVEIWLLLGCPALITSLLSERGKRLGDLFAGTFVIQRRLPGGRAGAALPQMSPELASWGAQLEMSGLTDQTAETARRYLARLPELTPAARAELGERIAVAVRTQVSPLPPPGTPVIAYLSTVLAERRNREQARLTAVPPGAGMAWSPPAGAAIQEPTGAAQKPTGAAWEGGAPGHGPPAAGGFVPPA